MLCSLDTNMMTYCGAQTDQHDRPIPVGHWQDCGVRLDDAQSSGFHEEQDTGQSPSFHFILRRKTLRT